MLTNRGFDEVVDGVWCVRNHERHTWDQVMHLLGESKTEVKQSAQQLVDSYRLPQNPQIPGSFLLLRRPLPTSTYNQMVALGQRHGGSIIAVEAGVLAALALDPPMPGGLNTVLIGHMPVNVRNARARQIPKRLAILEATGSHPQISTWDVGDDDKPLHGQVHGVLFRLV